MNQFTIRDIENLCGIKAHTLRIWEQRYKVFTPKRKQSRHRFYDCEDLKQLLRISFLYHQGYKISRIAGLSDIEIQKAVEGCSQKACNYEIFVHQLMEASIDYDEEKFERTLNLLTRKIGINKSIIHVFYPFLERVGLLWMTGNVIPAQEHFSSSIISQKIISAIDNLEPPLPHLHSKVLIFTPPGELHEIPLLVANYFFRKNGIATIYFGTNVSLKTLEYYLRHRPFTHIYTHVITYLKNPGLESFMKELHARFPGMKIIVSGPCCRCLSQDTGIVFLHSAEAINEYAGKFT